MEDELHRALRLLGDAVDLIDELTGIIENEARHRLTEDLGNRGSALMEEIGRALADAQMGD